MERSVSRVRIPFTTGAANSITCSHSRSAELFTESINSKCKFYAHTCPSGDSFEAGDCLGCPAGGCPIMGYEADLQSTLRGSFYLSTSGQSPYCGKISLCDFNIYTKSKKL